MSTKTLALFIACLVLGAFASSCDEAQKVKDCLSEYRYCEGRESDAAANPNSLCILCIRSLGLCLNDLKCYNTTWEHYSFLCNKKAHCRKCLMSPEEIQSRKEEYEKQTKPTKKTTFFGRMLGSIKSMFHFK